MLDLLHGQPVASGLLRRVVSGHLTNPLLLVGPEGTGRKFAVQVTARALLCSGTRQPDCTCPDCYQLSQGMHPDWLHLAPEERSLGVEPIRELLELVRQGPSQAPVRVVLLEEAETLTTAAANALLKVLEEPPPNVRFFLVSTSLARILPTIRSRCGAVSFLPLSEAFIVSMLSRYEKDATKTLVLARMSEGSVGRALQWWGAGRLALRDRSLSLLTMALNRDIAALFAAIDTLDKDLPLALHYMGLLLADLLLFPHIPTRIVNMDCSADIGKLSPRCPAVVWGRLRAEVAALVALNERTTVSLGFQVKALLAGFGVG